MVSAVPTGGTGYPASALQSPKLTKPEDQQQLLADAKAAVQDGIIDQQDIRQLQTSAAQKLFPGTDPTKLSVEQQKQVDALVADALDGNLDQQKSISNADEVVATAGNRETADFSPVGFAIPDPKDAARKAVQFSSKDVLQKLLKSDQPAKVEFAQKAMAALCDGFGKAAPAKQLEALSIVMQSGTPEQKLKLRDQLAGNPQMLSALYDALPADNLSTPESAALSLLMVNSNSEELSKKVSARLAGLTDPKKLTEFYDNAAKGLADFQLNNSPTKAGPEHPFGAMRKLAEAHFKNMSAEAEFQVLMKVDDDSGDKLLRPLIRSLDQSPEKKEAIRRLAQAVVDRNTKSEEGKAISTYTGIVDMNPFVLPFNDVNSRKRAELILKILDEPGDSDVASAKPANPVPVPDTKPAVVAPKPADPPLHPVVEQGPPVPAVQTPPKPAETVAPPVVTPAEPEVKLKDFSTEEFIRRLRAFKEKPDMAALLKGLEPEHRVKLARMLDACQDGNFTANKPGKAKDVVGELSDDAKKALAAGFEADTAKLAPDILKGLLSDPATGVDEKGQILGYMLDTKASQGIAFNALKEAHENGSFAELMPKILHEGYNASALIPHHLPADQAGQVLAWSVDANQSDKGYLTPRIQAFGEVLNQLPDDKAKQTVRAFAAELKTSPDALLQKMTPATLKQVIHQLERGGLAKQDEALYTRLSAALVASNNLQISDLMAQPNLSGAHAKQIQDILLATKDNKQFLANVEQMLTQPAKLPAVFGKPEDLAKVLNRLSAMGGDSRSRTAMQSLLEKSKPADMSKVWVGLDDKAKADPTLRAVMFYRFVDEGNFEMSRTLLKGDGKGLPPMDPKHPNTQNMLDFLSEKVTKFSNAGKIFGGNNDNTAEALTWILKDGANGGKARINLEQAFKQVDKMWMGNDAEVVRKFMDKIKANKDDFKGKLTLDMVRAMGSSLDSGYEKFTHIPDGIVKDALNFYLGGDRKTDHEQSMAAMKEIGRLVNADGKAALIRELMSGVNYDVDESVITDLVSMAQSEGQLPELARQIDFKKMGGDIADNLVFTQVNEAQIGNVALDLGAASRKATTPAEKGMLAAKADELIAGAPAYTGKVLSSVRIGDPEMLLRMNLSQAAKSLSAEDLGSTLERLKELHSKATTPQAKAQVLAKLNELAMGKPTRETAMALAKALPDDILKALPRETRTALHATFNNWVFSYSEEEKKTISRLGV